MEKCLNYENCNRTSVSNDYQLCASCIKPFQKGYQLGLYDGYIDKITDGVLNTNKL